MHCNHPITACSRHVYILLFFSHIPFVVNHTFNATLPESLQQHPLPFYNEPHRSHLLFVKASHGTTSTSWSQHYFVAIRKAPNDMCAKLSTVAARNNRVHVPQSLYYCLFAQHIRIVVLRAHPVRGEPHIQRNATREVATVAVRTVTLPDLLFFRWCTFLLLCLAYGWSL